MALTRKHDCSLPHPSYVHVLNLTPCMHHLRLHLMRAFLWSLVARGGGNNFVPLSINLLIYTKKQIYFSPLLCYKPTNTKSIAPTQFREIFPETEAAWIHRCYQFLVKRQATKIYMSDAPVLMELHYPKQYDTY